MIISFLLLLHCCPTHAITWEDRGGEAIRLGVVTATTTTPSGTYYSVTGNGVIAESRDGGMTWEPVSLPQSGIHFNSVKFFDDTHGIAVGEDKFIWKIVMFYLLQNAITRKQVGTQFQTKIVDSYDVNGPNSRCNLKFDEFPDFIPDLRFELEDAAKLTDILKEDNIIAKGFLVNEKVKKIFDQCLLPEHRYYDATVMDQKGNIIPYYWIHLISNDYQMVDFQQSVFRKGRFSIKKMLTPNDPIYPITDVDDYVKKRTSLIESDGGHIVIEHLKVHSQGFDMLHFSELSATSAFISEKMAKLLKKEKVTGIDIIEQPDIEVIE